jgi:hypothetical protein
MIRFARAGPHHLAGDSAQAELCRTVVWARNGIRALLDPALAARLRLTRSQRNEVFLLRDSRHNRA